MTEDHKLIESDRYIIRKKSSIPVTERPILVSLYEITQTTYLFKDVDRDGNKFRMMKEQFHLEYDILEHVPLKVTDLFQ